MIIYTTTTKKDRIMIYYHNVARYIIKDNAYCNPKDAVDISEPIAYEARHLSINEINLYEEVERQLKSKHE